MINPWLVVIILIPWFLLLKYFSFAADLFYTLCIVRLRNQPRYKRGLRRLGSQRSDRSQLRVVDGYHREQRPLDAKRFVPIRISWSRWSIWSSCLQYQFSSLAVVLQHIVICFTGCHRLLLSSQTMMPRSTLQLSSNGAQVPKLLSASWFSLFISSLLFLQTLFIYAYQVFCRNPISMFICCFILF
jgi:hypothetical protein